MLSIGRHAGFVLAVAQRWAESPNPRTRWVVREGLRKLNLTHREEVATILARMET